MPPKNNLVSIIIPAYNVVNFIEPCIHSLFAQKHKNIEVIIAYDEKSTDNTLEKLQLLAKKYPLIIDIGIDKGSGAARNRGFRLATGDYVIFVDGDDEVMPDYLSSMLSVFEQHPELNVVLCNYVRVNEDEVAEGKKKAEDSSRNTTLISRKELLYKKLWHQVSSAPWSYLIKRQYILDNKLTFPPYSHADDSFYTYILTDNSEYIGYCEQILYIFIQHDTSITHVLPDYWWRKYDQYIADMIQYFSKKDPEFCENFSRNMNRIRAYMAARRLSYDDFCAEMKYYNITRLEALTENDHLVVKESAVCFNISKKLYWNTVHVLNSIIAKINPLTQR